MLEGEDEERVCWGGRDGGERSEHGGGQKERTCSTPPQYPYATTPASDLPPHMRLSLLLTALVARTAAALSSTIIDVLGADPDYESLLGLLQRARLVPTLNRLNGTTLFAPTNDAIKKHSLWAHILDDDSFVVTDNVHEELRQQLFYHMLNFSIAQPEESAPFQTFDTLLYPHKPLDPPSREPPPHPPWMPVPSGTLGKKPQRLRAVLADENQSGRVAIDAFGKGGAHIVKPIVNATNGAVLGISDVLSPPPDLGMSPLLSCFTHL